MVSKINVVIIAVVVFVFIFIIGGGDGRNVSQHIVDVGLPAAYSYKTCKTLRSAALDQVAIVLCVFSCTPQFHQSRIASQDMNVSIPSQNFIFIRIEH
jgi:hypothetical protein